MNISLFQIFLSNCFVAFQRISEANDNEEFNSAMAAWNNAVINLETKIREIVREEINDCLQNKTQNQ